MAPRGAARALMLQGTGSDVGKSLLVAGLCRAWTRQGVKVRPFKPQNMSNNAAVTVDGGEIGRAQALQALACGIPPSRDMNPVLLKPQTDVGAQVIVQGRSIGNAQAGAFQALKPQLLPRVLESLARLAADADLVVVEGAGSAAEVNLRAGDIANMGFALAAHVPVVLVGDIDRGGVIASLVGTWVLLADAERALVRGTIINKFRGDPRLFSGGLAIIAQHLGRPSFGVVPWFEGAARLPAEDAVALERPRPAGNGAALIRIGVARLARIANFDDLDPLIAEPGVSVRFVAPGEALPGDLDLVLLPGTKATLADLAYFRAQGWDIDLKAHVRRGGLVVGLCGGYQMLGRHLADPAGIEGVPAKAAGLGLLDVTTVLEGEKVLLSAAGVDCMSGATVQGYEMHVGRTEGAGLERPLLRLVNADGTTRPEGAVSADGKVMGSYLHGLFQADGFRHAFLDRIRRRPANGIAYGASIEASLDALADHLEVHLDLNAMLAAAGPVRA
ncbi:MAG: cobyric acid synthase [Defluviicoccus sp.]